MSYISDWKHSDQKEEDYRDYCNAAAIEAVKQAIYNHDSAIMRLTDLPSVTHKSGKWINDKNDIPICSRCGYIPQYDRAIDDYEYSNYCPNCGSAMKGE